MADAHFSVLEGSVETLTEDLPFQERPKSNPHASSIAVSRIRSTKVLPECKTTPASNHPSVDNPCLLPLLNHTTPCVIVTSATMILLHLGPPSGSPALPRQLLCSMLLCSMLYVFRPQPNIKTNFHRLFTKPQNT